MSKGNKSFEINQSINLRLGARISCKRAQLKVVKSSSLVAVSKVPDAVYERRSIEIGAIFFFLLFSVFQQRMKTTQVATAVSLHVRTSADSPLGDKHFELRPSTGCSDSRVACLFSVPAFAGCVNSVKYVATDSAIHTAVFVTYKAVTCHRPNS